MKGHRSRGKANRVVVPRHGRTVRLSGAEKRWRRHDDGLIRGVKDSRRRARARAIAERREFLKTAPSTAKEKQAARMQRAIARERKGVKNLRKQAGELVL